MPRDFASDVRGLLLRITPERKDELETLLAGVTFHQDNSAEGIGFSAVAAWRFVRVSMRCQFRLWAHCYAYFSAFAAFDAKRQGQSIEGRYGLSDNDLQTAGDLLEWAVATDVGLLQSARDRQGFAVPDAPANMPKLFEGQTPSKLNTAASEVFLQAVAFIIHHELAHVQLGHSGVEGELSIAQEYEADEAAAEWLLSSDSMDEQTYLIRHLGVAIALIWFVSIYFRERNENRTHPPAWNRLFRALEPTVRQEVDAIWGFVVIALSLHFHRHGISLDELTNVGPTKSTVCEMITMIEKFNAELGSV